jgi:hypothetical protein
MKASGILYAGIWIFTAMASREADGSGGWPALCRLPRTAARQMNQARNQAVRPDQKIQEQEWRNRPWPWFSSCGIGAA